MNKEELKKEIAQLIKEDKYPDALQACGKLIRLHGSDEEIMNLCSFLFNRIQDAHYDYTPSTSEEFVLHGIAKFYKEEFESALTDYNKAIELDPNYDYAYKCRHLIYGGLGKISEALMDLTKAIELNPTGEYYNDL